MEKRECCQDQDFFDLDGATGYKFCRWCGRHWDTNGGARCRVPLPDKIDRKMEGTVVARLASWMKYSFPSLFLKDDEYWSGLARKCLEDMNFDFPVVFQPNIEEAAKKLGKTMQKANSMQGGVDARTSLFWADEAKAILAAAGVKVS